MEERVNTLEWRLVDTQWDVSWLVHKQERMDRNLNLLAMVWFDQEAEYQVM